MLLCRIYIIVFIERAVHQTTIARFSDDPWFCSVTLIRAKFSVSKDLLHAVFSAANSNTVK
jgi:hypothetical protein